MRIRKHLRNIFWGTYEDVLNPLLKRKGKGWIHSERMFENAFFVSKVAQTNPKTILDIGCSRSSVPIELATLGYKVTGIDLRNYDLTHPNFSFAKGDLTQQTFDTKFDLVACISVFEHVGLGAYGEAPNVSLINAFVKSTIENIKDNGYYVLTLPLYTHREGFIKNYSLNEIKQLFGGLKLVESKFFKMEKDYYVEIKHTENVEQTACLLFQK